MNRGCRASSCKAVRSSLIAVFRTDSLTNRWPQTSSSRAFLVSNAPGRRASAHSTANGVGGRGTALPSRNKHAFASSRSKMSKRTRKTSWEAGGRVGPVEVDTTVYLFDITAFPKGTDGRSPAIFRRPVCTDGCDLQCAPPIVQHCGIDRKVASQPGRMPDVASKDRTGYQPQERGHP